MKVSQKFWQYFNFYSPKDNYNKKIPPFSYDREKDVNLPVNINVSMSVIDILKIEEVDHVYTLKFRLILEWYICLRNKTITDEGSTAT